MADIVQIGVTGTGNANQGLSLTIAAPNASPAASNVYACRIYIDRAGTITAPDGSWQAAPNNPAGTQGWYQYVRVIPSSDALSFVFSFSVSLYGAYQISEWANVSTTTPLGGDATGTAAGNTLTNSTPSITPLALKSQILASYGCNDSNKGTSTAASGWTETAQLVKASHNTIEAQAYNTLTGSAISGSVTWGSIGSAHTIYTAIMALNPAAGSPAPVATPTSLTFTDPSSATQTVAISSGTTPYSTTVATTNASVATAVLSGSTVTVTPVGVGTCTLTVTDNASQTCTIGVTVGAAMTLSPTSLTFVDPASATQTSTISGGRSTYTPTSSNSAIATATVSGTTVTVTPHGVGSATITITDADSETATIAVTVGAALSLSPTSLTFTDPASAAQTSTISGGRSTYTPTTSNAAIATATVAGTTVTVTPATTAGTCTITITDADGETATIAITVGAIVSVSPASMTIVVGAANQTATVSGGRSAYSVASSATGVATATISGSTVTVHAVAAGSATVTVTDADSETCTIAVTISAVSVPVATPNTLTFVDPGSANQTSTISSGTTPYSTTVSTTNASVATATLSGSTVTVSAGTIAGTCTLTVTDNAAHTCTISVTVGAKLSLSPTSLTFATPTSANQTSTASGGRATYTAGSSNIAIATATVSGSTITVTPHGAGSCTITVTDADSETATITITVNAASGPSVSPTSLSFTDPKSATQTSTVSGGTAPFGVSTSDSTVATATIASTTVTITPRGHGSCTITVTDANSLTATVAITVGFALSAAPTVISLTPTANQNISLSGGRTAYTGSSSNVAIATVSVSGSTGTITAVAVGSCTITFTDADLETATVSVTVANAVVVKIPHFPDALNVGSVNRKTLVFIGLQNADTAAVQTSLLPQGTFLTTQAVGSIEKGAVTQSSHGYDIVKEFDFRVSAAFPHTLYGNQTDPRYDPHYNLSNPSADLKTYVCDAKRFMTLVTDNQYLAADYTYLFGTGGGSAPVSVYVGTPSTPSSTPVLPANYTWDAVNGIVTFTTAQAANAVVSIDGVPQAMAPELMLSHLFADYGHYDSTFFRFETSNIVLPTFTGTTDSLWTIARQIAAMTAPRCVAWRLRVDEYGYIRFYEDNYASTPTETLLDERDFLTLKYTYSSENLHNIVRAQSQSNNQQPIISISYDIDSVGENGQRDYLDIDASLLLSTRGMQSLEAKCYLDSFTAVQLTDNVQPTIEIDADVVANPARQVGDKVTVIEKQDGLSGPYIIKGITRNVQFGAIKESLRLRRALLFANYNMGLPSAIMNAPAPGSVAATPNVNATAVGKTGIIKDVSIGGIAAIANGATIKGVNGNRIIPSVTGSSWSFQFDLDPTQNFDTAVYQMLYLEAPNSLSSTDLMAMRLSNWVSTDGTVIPAATISSGYTQTSTHTTGSILSGGEKAYLYSNIVFPAHANSLSPGYAQLMSTLTYQTTTGLSGAMGIGTGPSYTGSYAYFPNQKYTYGYYVIVAFNAAGAFCIQRIPFTLNS